MKVPGTTVPWLLLGATGIAVSVAMWLWKELNRVRDVIPHAFDLTTRQEEEHD